MYTLIFIAALVAMVVIVFGIVWLKNTPAIPPYQPTDKFVVDEHWPFPKSRP